MSNILLTKEDSMCVTFACSDILGILDEAEDYMREHIRPHDHLKAEGWLDCLHKVQTLAFQLKHRRINEMQLELMEEYREEQAYQLQEPY